ncbi:hypothetical protein AYI69_g9046 [Smittium culicis]|uniref:Uncharacterized protein n=1 Tax=Smittium culicis TaxID=133412 RepID=A0A1R1XFB5_9FUNG|nr:hypothetical protein AYI69_g9046 [Smittium culicis]
MIYDSVNIQKAMITSMVVAASKKGNMMESINCRGISLFSAIFNAASKEKDSFRNFEGLIAQGTVLHKIP